MSMNDAAPPNFHADADAADDDGDDLPNEMIPFDLTGQAAVLLELDEHLRQRRYAPDFPLESPAGARVRRGLSPALILVLGTGPVARVLLEAGAMPLELRADDPSHEVWCAGFSVLAERVDAVFATEDWNRDAASRDAVLTAASKGIKVFFDVVTLRHWLRRREARRASAAARALKSDADELGKGSRS